MVALQLRGPKSLNGLRCFQGICGDSEKGSQAVALYPQVAFVPGRRGGPHTWNYVAVCKFHATPDWFDDGPNNLPVFDFTVLMPVARNGKKEVRNVAT